MTFSDTLRDVGRFTAGKVASAREKTRSYLANRDVRIQDRLANRDKEMQNKVATINLQQRLDAASASDYLESQAKRKEQEAIIGRARKERFESSFAGKFLSGAKSTSKAVNSFRKKNVAKGRKNGSLYSSDKFGGSVDRSVLRIRK